MVRILGRRQIAKVTQKGANSPSDWGAWVVAIKPREVVREANMRDRRLVFVVFFLMVQDRIDRRDPKLALAPIYAEPDMGFGDVPIGPTEGGQGQ